MDKMSVLKASGASLVALLLTWAAAGSVSAKTDPRASAKAATDALIASYLPASAGQASACSSKTHSGSFNQNRAYLAACASADGGFEVFVITNASTGSSLDLNSSFLQQQLNDACHAGAELFSAGIKGKVVQVFAGDGTEASLAKIPRDSYATAIQHLKGHTSQDLACHT
ncbi:MAG TPA: hypothetical protein VI462_12260 [Acidimicrobiia bacterium]